jgi:hypothetical protein
VFTPASATITATRDKVFSTPASLWTESDTSGGTIVEYQFWDTDTGGVGNFTLNGVVEANDQGFTVTPGQLSQLSYQIVSGTQIIYVRANDGTLTDPNWGAWSAGITVTAPPSTQAAVFTPVSATITATRDQVFSTPASLWTESDNSGGTIVEYQFWDTDTGGTGHFTLNGVVEANDQGFTVTSDQLSQLSYQIVSGTQIIYIRANDGTLTDPNWGAWSAGITVTAPPRDAGGGVHAGARDHHGDAGSGFLDPGIAVDGIGHVGRHDRAVPVLGHRYRRYGSLHFERRGRGERPGFHRDAGSTEHTQLPGRVGHAGPLRQGE